ncbi:MAG TPA: condensation domain-containing protein [Mycobacteriales bacterium]
MNRSGPTEPWVVPASYAQERVWFAAQLVGDSPVYSVLDLIELPPGVERDHVLAALRTVLERQEQLRTAFRLEDGELRQAVHDATLALPVEDLDLTGLPAAEVERRTTAALDAATVAIPLDTAPLWRAVLVRRGAGDLALLLVSSHAVVDGESEPLLRAELREACLAAAEGRAPDLPELPVQYADYAVWQRDRLAGGELDRLAAHWAGVLAGLPAVHGLPTDLPRPAERSFAGGEVRFALPDGAAAGIAALARSAAATPFTVLFAAWVALLRRLSGAEDVVVGVPVAGRDRPELAPLIGMFVNVLVVRVRLTGDPSFTELLAGCRRALLDAYDHQEMPFQVLVERLADRRDPAVPPLYQLAFNSVDAGFSHRPGSTEDDLMLEVARDEFRVEFNTALFTEATATAVAEDYRRVLAAVLADPEQRLSALPVRERLARPAAAAAPPAAAPPAAAAYVAPRTAAEELVAEVWTDVLGRDRIGALDDFFDLGGHSLLALRVIARLSAAAEIELPIQAFFADTTVAGVATAVESVLAAELDELTEDEAERLVERSRG